MVRLLDNRCRGGRACVASSAAAALVAEAAAAAPAALVRAVPAKGVPRCQPVARGYLLLADALQAPQATRTTRNE